MQRTGEPVTTPGSDSWARRSWLVSLAAVLALVIVVAPRLAGASPGTSPTPGSSHVEGVKPLVLAHYYIWFTPGSWNRAKKDTPLAGRYSSDDIDVMRTHVRQAQAAGIDGFIVSWKSTPDLNSRLANLVTVAVEQGFKLAITYQGLDFNRVPLPAARIAADLDLFAYTYGNNSVFDIFGKPLVVLTGTSVMTRAAIGKIAKPHRKQLLVLASDKNVQSYERIADLVDGNLYYWSSVNPYVHNGYAEKLISFGNAVRAHGGIWVAPAAPGFDARLVGGTSSIDRRDGETLRAEWNAAISSRPAAIGVISWNEFSENTHVEPSRAYGNLYLEVLAELTGAANSRSTGLDSSEPMGRGSPLRAILAVGGITGLMVASLVAIVRRRGQSRYLPRRQEREL
jgi:Glycosyl hydrolase family 71